LKLKNKKGCIVERISYMYLNEELSDVIFIVGRENEDKERFNAHKFVLSIGSSVFNAMFYGTGQKMSQTTDIMIPDVDSKSFKSFLRFLYTGLRIINFNEIYFNFSLPFR
jgi:BTB/POZ domain-containing protein 1/2